MPNEPTIAPPPSHPFGRRATLAAALLIAILCTLWLIWNHIASARLAAKFANFRAHHEPIFPADFASPSLSDDQNAALYFQNAATAMSAIVETPNNSNLNFSFPPFAGTWLKMADAVVIADQRSLALVHKARQFDCAVWYPIPPSPITNTLNLLPLNDTRSLANLIADAACQAHAHGDDALAMDRILDLLHQEDSLNQASIALVMRMVAVGLDSLATFRIEVISADNLQINNSRFADPPTTQPIHPVNRTVIEHLIHRLLDDPPQHDAELHALRAERMIIVDMAQSLISHATVLRPLLKLQELQLINDFDIILHAADQPNRPATLAILAPYFAALSKDVPSTESMQRTSYERFLEMEYRVLAERRAAALSLAARLYRCDYGHWPDSLNALVPAYLSAVPADPFLNPKTPFGYVLFNPGTHFERPMVYFDHSGTPIPIVQPATPCLGWQLNAPRQWLDLSAPTPLLPQTAKHNSH